MTSAKKRSLNEIRQTKDAYYIAPDWNINNTTNQVVKSYFSSSNNEINSKNYHKFLSFLEERGYQISKK
jgi:hypothetical protein